MRVIDTGRGRQIAAADFPDAAGAEIVGRVVEAVDVGVADRRESEQAIAADRGGIGRRPRVRAGGVAQRTAGHEIAEHDGTRRARDLGVVGRGFTRNVRIAEPLGEVPVTQRELQVGTHALHVDAIAVLDVVGDDIAAFIDLVEAGDVARHHRVGHGVEVRQRRELGVVVGAGDAHLAGNVYGRLVVEDLAVEADVAAVEFTGDVDLDLAAAGGGVAGLTRAFALAVEAADVEAPVFAEAAAIVEVDAVALIVEARRQLDRAAFDFTRLGDQVEDAAGRVRGEGRSRTAADRVDRGDIEVVAHESVGTHVREIAEFEDGHAVFLNLQILGAAVDQRKAADGIGVQPLASAAFDADAGNVAEQIVKRSRCDFRNFGLVERAGRGCAVEAVAGLGDAGGHQIVVGALTARFPGRDRLVCVLRESRRRVCGKGQGDERGTIFGRDRTAKR